MSDQPELLPDDPDETAELLAHADQEDVPDHRWPRQMAELVDVLADRFRRRGRAPEAALEDARETVLAIALYFGGKQFYLPKGDLLETALRHARIFHEHTGNNTEALAAKYELTTRQVQKIVVQQLRYRRGLRQGSLFPE